MKKFFLYACALCAISCQSSHEMVILFDNDVHCAVAGYETMAGLKDSLVQAGKDVIVVSAGDFVQGSVMGSISSGEYIVDIMNAVGYDYVTIGNHEFDYTVPKLVSNMNNLSAKVLCCNFGKWVDDPDNGMHHEEALFAPYEVRRFHGIKIGLIGAATPTTYNTSTPTYFVNEAGEIVYHFHVDDTFDRIQQAADKVRNLGADYVIVLSHLGDDTEVDNSVDMIHATHGIDAVLDGHQHHVLDTVIANAEGQPVILASTGHDFQYIGCLSLKQGTAQVQLLVRDSLHLHSDRVHEVIEHKQQQVQQLYEQVIGYTRFDLSDHDAAGQRAVRRMDTNISDLIADAMRAATDAEIGAIHGGSIRADIPAGDITLGQVLAVLPFNNHMSKIAITGQQLLDALEVSVRLYPEENGDFHIFSHLRYTIDARIPSSVELDERGMFVRVGATRRVVRAEVLLNNQWQPMDPQRTYTLGGLNYTLTNKGAAGMFACGQELQCEPVKDITAIIAYIQSLGDTLPQEYAQPQGRFSITINH